MIESDKKTGLISSNIKKYKCNALIACLVL